MEDTIAIFEWTNQLSIGMELIDEQHKKLVSLINELHDAMKNRKASSVIGNILDELVQYTIYHFATEEKAFDKYQYTKTAEHKKLHKDLVGKVKDFIKRHDSGEMALSVDILDFLIDWLMKHIMQEDRQYVPELKDKIEPL